MDRSRPSFMTKEQLDKYLKDLQQSRTIKSRVSSHLDQGVSKRWSMSEVPRVDPTAGVNVEEAISDRNRQNSPENYTTVPNSTSGGVGGDFGAGTGSIRAGRTERGPRGGWRANNGWIRPTRSNTIDTTTERGLSASGPQSNSGGNIQQIHNPSSKPISVQRMPSGVVQRSQANHERQMSGTYGNRAEAISDRNLNPTVEVQEDEDDPGYIPSEEPIAPAPLKITKAKTPEPNLSLHSSQRPETTPEVTSNNRIAYSANTAPNPGSGPPELEQRPKWNDMAIPTLAPNRPQTPPTKVMMVEDGKVVGEMVLPQEVDESRFTLARGNAWSKGVKPSPEVARLPMAMEKKLSGGSNHPQIQSMTFEEFAAMDLQVTPPGANTGAESGQVTRVQQSVDLRSEEKPSATSAASAAKPQPSRTGSARVEEARRSLEQVQIGDDKPIQSTQPEISTSVTPPQSTNWDVNRSTTAPMQQQYGRPAPNQISGPRANPRQTQAAPLPPLPQPIPAINVAEEPPTTVNHAPPRQRNWQQPPQRQRSQEQHTQQQSRPLQSREQPPIPTICIPDETPTSNTNAPQHQQYQPHQHLQQQQQRQQPQPQRQQPPPPIPTFSFSEDPTPVQRHQQPPPVRQQDYNYHNPQQHRQPASQPPIPTFSFSEDPSPARQTPIPAQKPPVPTISFPDDDAPAGRRAPSQQPPVPTISFSTEPSSRSSQEQPPSSQGRPLPAISVEPDRGHQNTSRPLPQAVPQGHGSSRPLPPPKDHAMNGNGRYDAYNTHYRHASDRIPRSKAICTACRNPITARAVNAMNFHFHPECFSCTHCQIRLEHVAFYPEPLPEGAPPNAPRSGRFFCHCDFHELFSPRCKSCKTPIESEVVVALGASWHVGHFFCAECGDPFDSSTKFVEKDNYAWCLHCYQRRYSTKCRRCRKPVTDTVVKALDAEWHVECFCCTECGSQFDDGRYFLRSGSLQEPVCVRCEEERLKS